jgi:hypothetical protein
VAPLLAVAVGPVALVAAVIAALFPAQADGTAARARDTAE